MSSSSEKKDRKERRKIIREELAENKDWVLEEVINTLVYSPFIEKFLFCFTIMFKKVVKK